MPSRPSGPAPFVGRTEELVALHDALDAASDGLVVALISGDAGVGKTSLARAFTQELRSRGIAVRWGSCTQVGGAPAFWPWVQVVRSFGPEVISSAIAELDSRAGEPFAAYDAVHDVLRGHAEQTNVLVLDDLHCADLASLDLLRFLSTTAADLPVLIVGIYRQRELRTDPARDAALATIAQGARRITPSDLGIDDIRTLLAPDLAADVAEAVLARSAGNALYVEQLVDAVWRDGPAALDHIPDGIRAAVRARLEPLPSETRRLLALAAVLAPPFQPTLLAALADTDVDVVHEGLAPAFDAGLIDANGDDISFTHVLVRDSLDDELTPSERRRAHVAAAEALSHGDDVTTAARVVQHLLDAGDLADPRTVAHWADAAAARSRRLSGHAVAARWTEEAARAWGRAGDLEQQGNHLAEAINDRVTVGDGPGAVALSMDLADLARQAGSARLLARAALARCEAFAWSQDVEVPPLLREALAHPGIPDTPEGAELRADLLAALAALLGIPSADGVRRDQAGALAAVAELEALADTGPSRCRGRLAEARLNVFSGPAHHQDRKAWLAEYRTLVPTTLRVTGRLSQLYWATSLAFEDGDLLEVDRLLREWELLADRSDSSFWKWRGAMARASLLLAQGQLDEAEAQAVAGSHLVATMNPEMGLRVATGLVIAVRREQGRLHEVRGLGRTNLGILNVLLVLERGDLDEARRLLGGLVVAADATGPDDLYWLCLLSLIAVTADAVGDAARCAWAADRLEPYVDQHVMWGRSYVYGPPVSELIAVARRGAGQLEASAAAFERELSWAERVGAVGFAARARRGLAGVLGAAATPDLARAAAAAEVDAAEPLRARVRTLGRFEVVGAGASTPTRWSSRKARDALKILICRRGGSINREELIEVLWPDVDLGVGRSRLSVVLSMVRQALDPDRRLGVDVLRADRQAVALNLDVVSVDVEELLRAARSGLGSGRAGPPDLDALLSAAALADAGAFLSEDPYADFARPVRALVERTERDVLAALARVAEEAGDQPAATRWSGRLVELDQSG